MSNPDPWIMEVKPAWNYPDFEEVRRTLPILCDPSLPHAIQGLKSGQWFPHRRGDPLPMEDLLAVSNGTGTYFSLNPLRPDVKPRRDDGAVYYFTNKDIAHRRWLLIDSDPARGVKGPDGKEDKAQNATEEEKGEATAVAQRVAEFLEGLGFPPGIFIDSGNGWHWLHRIDLPNNDHSRLLIAHCLKAIAGVCDTPMARVDTALADAKRISKLPGTWARKGPHSAERPHRMARVIWTPGESIEAAEVELLMELAARVEGKAKSSTVAVTAVPPANGSVAEQLAPIVPQPAPIVPQHLNGHAEFDPWVMTVKTAEHFGYAKAALEAEVNKVLTAGENRNTALYNAALKMGNFVATGYLPEAEVYHKLCQAGVACGLGQDGDPHEIDRAVSNGLEAGKKHPREAPAPKAKPEKAGEEERPWETDPEYRLIILGSEVTPRRVEWLWPDRLPFGKLTTWAGWGGLGKSFISMDIAARITTGEEIPGAGGLCFNPGKVLVMNSEDDPDDTSVPRLLEAGADVSKVAFLRSEVLGCFTLADIPILETAIRQHGGDVSLIILDPAASMLGDRNDHRNAELQKALTPLKIWAMGKRVAIILITHVSKPPAGKVEAAARVIGGVAWTNAVRSAAMFLADPDDKSRALYIPFKTNNGPMPKGLAYRIIPSGEIARVQWEGEVDYSADEAMEKARKVAKAVSESDVVGFVKDQFLSTIRVPSVRIWDIARQEGIPEKQLKKAKKDLGIRAVKEKTEDGRDVWFWIAPQQWPEGTS